MRLFIASFCFQEALDRYLVAPKADTKVPVEVFRWDSLQKPHQFFEGSLRCREKLFSRAFFVPFDQHGIVGFPLAVMMFVEGR